MRTTSSKAMIGLAAMTLAFAMSRPVSAGAMTYISLGDSVAFGETGPNGGPSYGDRGYVSGVADKLGSAYGGVRPNVINLGVAGETTTSFFGGGSMAAPQNLNYANTVTSQNTMLISKISSEQAAGNTIAAVSISLGASDLFALTNSASFQAMTPPQQQMAILASMSTIQNNYTAMLTMIKALAPTAAITIVGPFNAVAPLSGDSPVLTIPITANQILNAVIAGQAAAFGADYVDTQALFLGKESEYQNGTYPTAAGYGAISGAFNTVPEPTTMAIMSVLGIGLAGRAARRKMARTAA